MLITKIRVLKQLKIRENTVMVQSKKNWALLYLGDGKMNIQQERDRAWFVLLYGEMIPVL